jgi:hypothetical protein
MEELYALYSPNIVWAIKSRRLRWAGHVALGERGEVHTGFYRGNLRERDHSEVPGLDGKIILEWIFAKWDGWHGQDWSGSGQGQVASSCKYGNEPSGSTKCGEFPD